MLEGKKYTPDDMYNLITEGKGNHPSTMWSLHLFLNEWFNNDPVIAVYTSDFTRTPKELFIHKGQMIQSARLACRSLDLKQGETMSLCMSLCYIGVMTVVVRSLIVELNLIVCRASGHPSADVSTPLRFATVVPLQVYNIFQISEEKEKLKQTEISIIGDGAVDKTLEEKIRDLPNTVYSAYGMTGTLSHIALRRLNSATASDCHYPFSSVELFLSSENTLMINVPLVRGDTLQTNDIARIYPDGSFTILGRKDSVINSGGIKVQAEETERLLQSSIPIPFVITSIPGQRLGQVVTSLIEGQMEISVPGTKLESALTSYYRPKYIYTVNRVPRTGSGKINRKERHVLAGSLQLLGRQE